MGKGKVILQLLILFNYTQILPKTIKIDRIKITNSDKLNQEKKDAWNF